MMMVLNTPIVIPIPIAVARTMGLNLITLLNRVKIVLVNLIILPAYP